MNSIQHNENEGIHLPGKKVFCVFDIISKAYEGLVSTNFIFAVHKCRCEHLN